MLVYKYTIPVKSYFSLDLPYGAKILTVQTQREDPQIWALVDPEQRSMIPHNFRIVDTSENIAEDKDDLEYIGTFQLVGGNYVGHLFEIIGK